MKIITDHKWKKIRYSEEVPIKVLDRDFDHLEDHEVFGFIKYRNNWYHVSDFERIGYYDLSDIKDWDGRYCDTLWTATLIKFSDDGESYKIGTFIA